MLYYACFSLIGRDKWTGFDISWLDPLRPYLLVLTVLVLGFSWYQKLKPKNQNDCDCITTQKETFIQTKKFLGIVTVFAGLMLAFPAYAHIFFSTQENKNGAVSQTDIKTTEFIVAGMTCTGCEEHVNHEVNKLDGIVKSTASFEQGNAIVAFDSSLTSVAEIEEAIKRTGYSVTGVKEN